ncbi:MAG: hypothetical protein H6673_15795 [Anaerolineales bacterium]|nr:hypothetical protein [Anaerolineales bacterium]
MALSPKRKQSVGNRYPTQRVRQRYGVSPKRRSRPQVKPIPSESQLIEAPAEGIIPVDISMKEILATSEILADHWLLLLEIPVLEHQKLIIGSRKFTSSYTPDIDLSLYQPEQNQISSQHIEINTFEQNIKVFRGTYPVKKNNQTLDADTEHTLYEGDVIHLGNILIAVQFLKEEHRVFRLTKLSHVSRQDTPPDIHQLLENVPVPVLGKSYPRWILDKARQLITEEDDLAEAIETVLLHTEVVRNATTPGKDSYKTILKP